MKWDDCASLPVPISVPKVVKIGSIIYVGGGIRPERESRKVFMYNLDQGDKATWTTLKYCPTYWHSLAVTKDDELIAIGGKRESGKIVSSVWTYRNQNSNWVPDELPPIKTARCNHSSITYKNKLIIVVGGLTHYTSNGKTTESDTVEVYNMVEGNDWFSTESLPFALAHSSLKIINDKCYIEHSNEDKDKKGSVIIRTDTDLSTFLEHVERGDASQCPLKWGTDQCPLLYATVAEIEKVHFIFGGFPVQPVHIGTNSIHAYDPKDDKWMKCTGMIIIIVLSTTVYACTV